MENLDKSILVFATDAKVRKNWDLPFVRLGTMDCNSAVHSASKFGLETLQLPVSEANSLWHISKHLADYGNPDYVGLCHHRRFFTCSTKYGILPVKTEHVDKALYLSPEQQKLILIHEHADGIVPIPFKENYHVSRNKTASTFYEEAYNQSVEDKMGLDIEDYKLAFDVLFERTPVLLKPFMTQAFSKRTVHFGTIFTLSRELFNDYVNIVLPALLETLAKFGRAKLMKANSRCGGHLLERMSSCLFWSYKLAGKKLLSLPLVVADFDANPSYRIQTTEERGLVCDIEGIEAIKKLS